ncbi:MAG: HEAT repeat domain-containing protein [Chloroflexota bacterium]
MSNQSVPLTEETLIEALECIPGSRFQFPEQAALWIEQHDPELIQEMLLKILLETPRGIFPREQVILGHINPMMIISRLVAHLFDIDKEQHRSILSKLHFFTAGVERLNLPTSDPIIQNLLALLAEPTTTDRYMVVKLLCRFGCPDLFDHFLLYLDDEDRSVYCQIVQGLIWFDLSRSLPIIKPLLQSSDEILRWQICGALSWDTDDSNAQIMVIELLVDRLLHDMDSDVRFNATFALSKVGDLRAVEALTYAALYDDGMDYDTHRIDHIAAEAIEEIIIRDIPKLLKSSDIEVIIKFLPDEFRQTQFCTALLDTICNIPVDYGSLLAIKTDHRLTWDTQGTPYCDLNKPFGVQFYCFYEYRDSYFTMVFLRTENQWLMKV